jgi:hypothetical protein
MSSKLNPSPFDLLIWSEEALTLMRAEQVWKLRQWEMILNSPFPSLVLPYPSTIPDHNGPVTPSPLPDGQQFPT